jgi:hypothetical protein
MQFNKKLLLMIGLVTLGGYAFGQDLSRLSPEQLTRLASIEILKADDQRPVSIMRTVVGVSCQRAGYFASEASEEDAINMMKFEAMTLNADAIKNKICIVKNKIDWRRNCNATIDCAGVAVRFTTSPPSP